MIKIPQHKEYKVEEHVTFFMIHDIQLWKKSTKKKMPHLKRKIQELCVIPFKIL